MTTKKQTRRSVSMSGEMFTVVAGAAHGRGISMSEWFHAAAAAQLERDGVAPADIPAHRPGRSREPR